MSEITVQPAGRDTYGVTVSELGSSTTHWVTVAPADVARLAAGTDPIQLVEASFRFLLDHEPKESILERFEIGVIGRYFPDYPSRLGDYL